MLKKPSEQDSNQLDRNFYTELLHIIGLEETPKIKGKILIKRKAKPDSGSLLEKAIDKIESKFSRFDQKKMLEFGATHDERVYNIALELCIVWTNRVLFLKLLESQLVAYHDDKDAYSFLSVKTINNFGELYVLFHDVLNKTIANRNASVKAKYAHVPYLNSSLFDFADVENLTVTIDELDNNTNLTLPNSSILKKIGETKNDLPTLEYLFRFLDAYDFASEGKEDVQKENRPLINASVLGKVFEKINGYKDGSIYTPGFITMYMCRQAIRLAVVQKFKDETDFDSDNFDDLRRWANKFYKADDIKRCNEIINSIKLCDPAVGSGHFLVSALNEILAIKSELGVFADAAHNPFSNYKIEVANDELIVTDRERKPFAYKIREGYPLNDEMQNLQTTLFHEKQMLIENCLFGVNINPNSVKICRLRLWIELLKNSYYKDSADLLEPPASAGGLNYTELETLPNIDINIKQGNSLLSRFALDADLREVLKQVEYSIEDYQNFVQGYKETRDREAKRDFEAKIKQIKDDFKVELNHLSPERIKLADLKNQLKANEGKQFLFGEDEDKRNKRLRKIENLKKAVTEQEKLVKDTEENVIYKNAFEWRFEFPEVLDNDGNFLGFDIVIGNPPYIFARENFDEQIKNYFSTNYSTSQYQVNLFLLFVEKTISILSDKGEFSLIVPNSLLMVSSAQKLRKYILEQTNLHEIINLIGYSFQGINVETIIISAHKGETKSRSYLKNSFSTK
ncbi:MAG: N-6 DNA methylase [Acidobacteriota bacterium]|nr:N-6 DNA methylase [Acidobacteriota bacterium]